MDDLLKLDAQVCFPVYALSREITNLYRPILEQLDLTYPQYLVLLVLWENKTQTVNQIGGKLQLDNGTLTPLLKRLEVKGLVNRTRSKLDERVVDVSLTVAGNALKDKAKCIPKEVLEALNVSVDDLQQLKDAIEKIVNRNK
ncbi:MarR family transcriptional regulator [Flavobacterium sp.]|uniref:MarR family winged helix-turn-helix transcriptional regulator n=1 Tax=Flavobacterium sp. TaxID=239 RepID=UPI002602763E|nr:MarR family transcriptional regulator [Flavobacterium sp.]MDG2433737.1 MarR family transcriptional regulator [Flavobacterium sp.]